MSAFSGKQFTKEELAIRAKEHINMMGDQYKNDIDECVVSTINYDNDKVLDKIQHISHIDNFINDNMKITLIASTTVDTALSVCDDKPNSDIALLNFASYKNAGGAFQKGMFAQEESLCHSSYLFNVLSEFPMFYSENRQHLNHGMYENKALFSPNVKFFDNDNNKSVFCSVITCAAPNKSPAIRYGLFTNEENTEALRSRIKFILDIAYVSGVKTLILGAFGAGVFKQDPHEVANIFKEYLTTTHKVFDNVIFAIPNITDKNYIAFDEILSDVITPIHLNFQPDMQSGFSSINFGVK